MSDHIYIVHDVLWGNIPYYFKSWDSALKRAHKEADEFDEWANEKLDRTINPEVERNIWWSKKHLQVVIIEKVFVND
jgi:hypothetical protein